MSSFFAGIALFQIANTQFLHIASQQKRYMEIENLEALIRGKKLSVLDGRSGSTWERTYQRLQEFDKITRMVVYVGIGLAIQV